jgi:hypothetical protein
MEFFLPQATKSSSLDKIRLRPTASSMVSAWAEFDFTRLIRQRIFGSLLPSKKKPVYRHVTTAV